MDEFRAKLEEILSGMGEGGLDDLTVKIEELIAMYGALQSERDEIKARYLADFSTSDKPDEVSEPEEEKEEPEEKIDIADYVNLD